MLIIFDKDGTLVEGTNGPIPNNVGEQVIKAGVLDRLNELREKGHSFAVASNQGGVAFGHLTYEEAEEMVRQIAQEIGAEAYEFCPYHPEGAILEYRQDHFCRKPAPGMLFAIMDELMESPSNTLFVGDRPEDYGAAISAGIAFVWAQEFFL